jgi:hypothetical protein
MKRPLFVFVPESRRMMQEQLLQAKAVLNISF